MLLAIDIGNTNTVFGVYEESGLLHTWRCRTIADRCGDEYAALLTPWLQDAGLAAASIKRVLICSVVPDVNTAALDLCRKYFAEANTRIVTHDMLDMPVRLDNPAEIGTDRLVNALAVRVHYAAPAIVVDFGTATTFDVIGADGGYEGGVIAPGINLSLEALSRAAAKLPKIQITKPAAALGRNTVEAMQSGLYWGYLGLIDGILEQLQQEIKAPPRHILATGGLAPMFAPPSRWITGTDDSLTLKGLAALDNMLTTRI